MPRSIWEEGAIVTLEELIAQQPLIHNDRTITWGIRPALAEFLDARIGPGAVTLETGAGLSTLVILRKQPRQHTSIQPVADEFAAILEFAEKHGIDTRGFLPVVAPSQQWLPQADLPDLDLVLVDGAHAFPVPFIDWYYSAERLRAGGLMIVDDTHLLTGTILADFMEADPRWEEVKRDRESHFAIYRKRSHPVHDDDWTRQPYVHDAYPTERVSFVRGAGSPVPPEPPKTPLRESVAPRLQITEIRGWEEYRQHRADRTGEYLRREAVERSLIDFGAERFAVPGYCAVCDRPVRFDVTFTYAYQRDAEGRPLPNWREQLACECGLVNRMRAAAQIVAEQIRPPRDARIYVTERVTHLYRWLEGCYPGLVGSEFLGTRVPLGTAHDGIRNEDLTALTFDDQSFDLILSFDVMEHVPDSDRALRECFRCLKPGGLLVFGAPFRLDCRDNTIRARMRPDGTIEHLAPPEYHANPVDVEGGALCFRHFGWEVLQQMTAAGFSDPRAFVYWSRELGYLGGDQVLLVASRPAV